jgi:hypothetical protein
MITFNPRQSDCARRARNNESAGTLQIHVTNCAAKLHSHFHAARKTVHNNLSSAGQAHVMKLFLYAKQALPLVKTRFLRLANSSPKTARSPARRSRDGREPSGKKSGECLESYPRNVSAMAGQWQRQCHRTSVKTTCKTTCLAADLAAPCPRRNLARRLASNLNHDIQKL